MALETTLKLGSLSLCSPFRRSSHGLGSRNKRPPPPLRVHVFRTSRHGSEIEDEEIVHIFLKDRQTNGDFISKVSDILWRREELKYADSETSSVEENIEEHEGGLENESLGGYLKLTKTHEWVSGDSTAAPVNKKLIMKDWQNDSDKRRKLNLLRYDAIKRELLLLTVGIGSACSLYCLLQFSVEAAVSYAAGVLFSCLYLQLLYNHTDKFSREAVPEIFLQKRVKKIGIRSEDLKDTLEKTFWGSTMALSSPRLVIPAALYGIWIFSNNILHNSEFQIVPGMLGFFAYKAAALVQVYRDNEDLRFIFAETEENPDGS